MTGALASYGEGSLLLLNEAVKKIEDDGGSVALRVADTNSTPEMALTRLKEMHGSGIRIVIGPYSSSEVAAVLPFANEHGIILISPLSTAHRLAIADDNLFRFTPDDVEEGVAVANLAWDDGVRTLLLVNRDDAGNGGLVIAVRDAFPKLGGSTLDGVVYGPNETDFSDEVAHLETVLASSAQLGEVGVYLAGFGEVGDLLTAVSHSPSLSSLKWYGSNSVALSGELIANPTGAAFAVKAGYPNPILGLRPQDEPVWGPISLRVSHELGRAPDAFALAAYDSLVIAYKAASHIGEALNSEETAPGLREHLPRIANQTVGLTGPLDLNEAGDRDEASYDFWSVCQRLSGEFTWVRSATYSIGDGVQNLSTYC
jgi:branched-chain amino acid transport system substrate-binding protein